MDYTAFSHGQIQSKLWLCETLEKHISFPTRTAIIGSWYNILGFMLLTRNQDYFEYIHGYDIDSTHCAISDKICDAWMINLDQKIKNMHKNVNDVDFSLYDLIISTSIEDIKENIWYNNIQHGTMICLQTIDLSPEISQNYPNWRIQNHIPNMDAFKKKYPLGHVLFEGIREYDYIHLKYNRFMIIGKK